MCQCEQTDPGQTAGGVDDEVGDIGAPDGQDVLGDLLDQARTGDRARGLPASIGEFWMIGYLLFRGLGRRTADEPAAALAR